MWNLVAEETGEAQVYIRLLEKIEEQPRARRASALHRGDGTSGG